MRRCLFNPHGSNFITLSVRIMCASALDLPVAPVYQYDTFGDMLWSGYTPLQFIIIQDM